MLVAVRISRTFEAVRRAYGIKKDSPFGVIQGTTRLLKWP